MTMNEDVNSARKKLFEKLGDLTKPYCLLMKKWFSMKINKEEFDVEVRKLMNVEQTKLHNEFLLCLFNKCSFLSSDNVKTRINGKKSKSSKQKRSGEKRAFQPVDPVNYLPQLEVPPQHLQEEAKLSIAQDYFLPDVSFLKGRLMLGAWELGMEGADDDAAKCLVVAVQYFLKNILTAIMTQRSGFKLHDRKLIHSVGCPVPNPWLRNIAKKIGVEDRDVCSEADDIWLCKCEKRTLWYQHLSAAYHLYVTIETDDEDDYRPIRPMLTSAELEQKATYEIACSNIGFIPPPKPPISVYDVLSGLMVHKSTIPSHSIYADNIERIICSLNHPTWEDIEAAKHFKSV